MQTKRNTMRAILFIMALMLVFAALAGCSAKLADPVVGKVGNRNIYYSTYYSVYYNNMYYASLYGAYNVSTNESYRAFQDMVFDSIIDDYLLVMIAQREGVTLTAEEEAQVQADLEEQIESLYASYESSIDPSITDEAEKRAAEEVLFKADLKASGTTLEKYTADVENGLREVALGEKYRESLMTQVQVTDADIQAYYNEQLAYYKERYDTAESLYNNDYMSYVTYGGLQPLVVPDGLDYYKHILILNPEDGEDKDVDAIVAEIYAKIEAGEDFDALIEEYGEDPGSASEPYKTDGYMIGEANKDTYYEAFAEAALALENEGDITEEAVESEAGKHIIKKCGHVEARTVPLEEVEDEIREAVRTQKEEEAYADYQAQWRTEVKIKKYYERVNGLR